MRTRILSVSVLALLAVAVTGCSKEIDAGKAESGTTKIVEKQTGAKVKSVECPEGLTAEKGKKFQCTVTGTDGSTGKVDVTEKDDQGNVNVQAPFFHVRDLEKSIAADISKQVGSEVKVVCPEIIVGKQGEKWDCNASDETGKALVHVTQTDAKGGVDYKVEKQ